MQGINISSLPPAVNTYFNKAVLAFEQPGLIYGLFPQRDVKPTKTGSHYRYEKISKLPRATVPLGEDFQSPPGVTVSNVFFDAKIDFYGTWMRVHKQVTLTNDCPVLNEFAKRLGVSLRETVDELLCAVLASTSSSVNAVGGISTDNPTELTASDLDNVVRALKNNSAQLMTQEIEATEKISTAGVRPAYWMLSSTELIGNFERITNWQPFTSYSSSIRALRDEWGAYGSIRVLITGAHYNSNISANASKDGFDVYNNFVIAKEAFSHIEQEQAGPQYIYIDPLVAGGPLALYGTVGYTTSFSGKVLQDKWLAKVRCTRLN